MEDNARNRRKNYFIKKKFQTRFIIKFCALVIIGSVISGAIIYTMSKATVTTTFENSRLTIKSTADFILPAVLLSSAIVIALIGLATIAVTLFTSHRIAGPLYRVEKDIEEMASGNLKKKFSLRKSDELKALTQILNEMAEALRTDIDGIKGKVSELESTAGTDKFKTKLEEIKTALSKFIT